MTAFYTVRSAELKDCSDAFMANMDRMVGLALLPAQLAFEVRRETLFTLNALHKIEGRKHLSLEQFSRTNLSPKVIESITDQMREFDSSPKKYRNQMIMDLGGMYVDLVLETDSGVRNSMDALFASIVTSAWSAFEGLAADAWVACINGGPVKMRQRAMLEAIRPEGHSPKKAMSDVESDPMLDMGRFLIESRSISFQSLQAIKDAFKLILGDDGIEKIINKDEYLKALSAVRNIIIHRQGRADSKFFRETQQFPEFRGYKTNDLVLLDGEIVKTLRDSAAYVAMALLEDLDEIIKPLPNDYGSS